LVFLEISPRRQAISSDTVCQSTADEIYVCECSYSSPTEITDHNGWLKDYSLAQSEVVKWKSKDGTEIEGVLTKPVGYESGKVPFLLNPHGGPTGASLNSWSGTLQVLAANGFRRAATKLPRFDREGNRIHARQQKHLGQRRLRRLHERC
jgi:hypothetical protein